MSDSIEKKAVEPEEYNLVMDEHWQKVESLDGKPITECDEFKNFKKVELDYLNTWVVDGYLKNDIKKEIVIPGYPLKLGGRPRSMKRLSARWQYVHKRAEIGQGEIFPFLQPPVNENNNRIQGFLLIQDLLKGKKNLINIVKEADLAYIQSNWALYESKICTYIAMTGDFDVIDSFVNPTY